MHSVSVSTIVNGSSFSEADSTFSVVSESFASSPRANSLDSSVVVVATDSLVIASSLLRSLERCSRSLLGKMRSSFGDASVVPSSRGGNSPPTVSIARDPDSLLTSDESPRESARNDPDSRRSGVDTSISSLFNVELAILALDALEELIVPTTHTSKMILAEARKLLRAVGEDTDVTLLYEACTNARAWRAATRPYECAREVSVMFGLVSYRLECPLDSLVYSVLSERSFTVAYGAYKRFLTVERAAVIERWVMLCERAARYVDLRPAVIRKTLRRVGEEIWNSLGALLPAITLAVVVDVTNERIDDWRASIARTVDDFFARAKLRVEKERAALELALDGQRSRGDSAARTGSSRRCRRSTALTGETTAKRAR